MSSKNHAMQEACTVARGTPCIIEDVFETLAARFDCIRIYKYWCTNIVTVKKEHTKPIQDPC